MIELKLNKDQDAYDIVGEYIEKYWEEHPYTHVIVRIATSYDGKTYAPSNEFVAFDGYRGMEYQNDWWEGERYLRIYGIIDIHEVNVPENLMMNYRKITNLNNNSYAICAIYEPHPFRNSVISEAVSNKVDTEIRDNEWVWVYYDWCGNPIDLSNEKPNGIEVEKFTSENLGFDPNDENGIRLANYLNKP